MPAMTAVLHLYDDQLPAPAGALLRTLRRRSDDLFVRVGGRGRPDLPEADHVVRRPWPRLLSGSGGVRRIADERSADAIHCWTPALADLATATGRPTFVSLFRPPTGKAMCSIQAAVEAGAHLIVTSRTLADELRPHVGPAERVHVVGPAVEPFTFSAADKREARHRLGVDPDVPLLLAPQTHSRDEGPPWTMWAVSILHFINRRFELLVDGDGPVVARAKLYAADPGLTDRLHLPGRPRTDADLWAAADIAILFDTEGFALPSAAAAVASRTPIIAADAGELAATLTHEQTALLVEPGVPRLLSRAILQLHENPDLAAQLADAATMSLTPKLKPLTDEPAMLERLSMLYTQTAPAGVA